MTNPDVTRPNTQKGHIGSLFPSHSHERTNVETTGNFCPKCPPTTPPADYKPAPWVAQFDKRQLQWLAEQLQERQHKARTAELDAHNRATLAEARLTVLEAAHDHQEPPC